MVKFSVYLNRYVFVMVCKCPSLCFTDNPHSDKIIAAINNLNLAWVQTRGLISFVNDNHVDKKKKKPERSFDVGILKIDCKQSTQKC